MNPNMTQRQAAAQAKARKFAVITFVVVVALCIAAGFAGSLPKRLAAHRAKQNHRAMQALFDDDTLARSDAEPVIKRPYTVYGMNNDRYVDRMWEYRLNISDTALVTDAGITESVKDARTCVFVWPDPEDATRSSKYYWGTASTYDHDAWFCPVYMTVIDREAGIRYAVIHLGSVPLRERTRTYGHYSGDLYDPDLEWCTFDLDSWLATHWEGADS